MTPTPAKITKKLEAALKTASPVELARIMHSLYQPLMDKAYAGESADDPRTDALMIHIRDTFVTRLTPQQYNEFRQEASRLRDMDAMYRLQCEKVRLVEDSIAYVGVAIETAVLGTKGLMVASYELGDYTEEDDESSPLKPWLDMLRDTNKGLQKAYRTLIERRARLALSSLWDEVGRPCPIDPVFSSEQTATEALLGRPIPGSKELPLSRETVQAEEAAALKAHEAGKAKKARRKAAKK